MCYRYIYVVNNSLHFNVSFSALKTVVEYTLDLVYTALNYYL